MGIGGGGCCIGVCSICESRIFFLEQGSYISDRSFAFLVELYYFLGMVVKLIGYQDHSRVAFKWISF